VIVCIHIDTTTHFFYLLLTWLLSVNVFLNPCMLDLAVPMAFVEEDEATSTGDDVGTVDVLMEPSVMLWPLILNRNPWRI
jgi:hypothetical protein